MISTVDVEERPHTFSRVSSAEYLDAPYMTTISYHPDEIEHYQQEVLLEQVLLEPFPKLCVFSETQAHTLFALSQDQMLKRIRSENNELRNLRSFSNRG